MLPGKQQTNSSKLSQLRMRTRVTLCGMNNTLSTNYLAVGWDDSISPKAARFGYNIRELFYGWGSVGYGYSL